MSILRQLFKAVVLPAALMTSCTALAADSEPVDVADMQEWRQSFHANPELGFEEVETSAKVSELLTSWQFDEVHTGIAQTGVVGVLHGKNGATGESICLRADMDALGIQEDNDLVYASRNEGKMHACGHDGHTAMLLGAAKSLAENRNFDGTVYFVFQPAEEGKGGAREMIKDGLFERFDCDAIYGMHTWPDLTVGTMAVTQGPTAAASDRFYITIKGKGGHAAFPHHHIDSISIAANIINAINALGSGNTNPLEGVIASVTNIHGGTAYNAMPEEVKLTGTVRSFNPKTRDMLDESIQRIAQNLAEAHGATANVEYVRGYPPLNNPADQAAFMHEVATDIVGEDRVQKFTPTMGAEDFAFYLEQKPGAFITIGQADDNHQAKLHSPHFDFNDDVLPIGANYWVKLVEKALPYKPVSKTVVPKPR